ncbi:tyrosine-type recombinase/integrase [Eoetvoesiella caeni]|uniref:Site-specific recombinase XerD n=1 Tax=Eoetvoesiella caeni TaxID=645616 RepID=A0A366H8M7_9BURK|nr:tyrosine-type recombinase/integrase [Eoetvoesiella caeni]MCI2809705.1 site-specific integrase [Eoetvoesiella caeni]NYT56378.1 site-specific integrase [Eoetvoesiella caeni]RBP38437.1 site-specific recombinase XerD [Eoetvoesiella caeni]
MATILNRSRYTVAVKHREDLYKEFPCTAKQAAREYCKSLRSQGLKPKVAQLENKILVRIRNKGFPAEEGQFESMAEAEHFIQKVESEHREGKATTFLKSRKISFVQLLERYILQEGPKRPVPWETVEKYRFNKFLREGTGNFNVRERRKLAKELDVALQDLPKKLTPDHPWMQKPFADVTAEDIEDYIQVRQDEGLMPSTIDRELDSISAVFSVAINVWGYSVTENAMKKIRRPKYFNERDRRLKVDERRRLLLAACAEDNRRCYSSFVDEMMEQVRKGESFGTLTAAERKVRTKVLRAQFHARAEKECDPVSTLETLIVFLLCTAARRGEALALKWEHVDLEGRSAHFPMTKNGRPRTVPLRREIVNMLGDLPRKGDNVFNVSVDTLKNAWQRMLKGAAIKDLHVHDLRHEAISAIAETGKFSLIDLQAISGHKDVRMLLRYSHLCVRKLATRLDEVFAQEHEEDSAQKTIHRGRIRLPSGKGLKMGDLIQESIQAVAVREPEEVKLDMAALSRSAVVVEEKEQRAAA